ncbi:MAG: DUF4276 family protein [Thermoguttaceae bacterium]|jgi:hypothetical protein|nr:DUF4276 family protein [Thermoguttaceae bacterium]
MKRIVLFVEGDGDEVALPRLVKRLLTEQNVWAGGDIFLDENPFRVGQVGNLLKNDCRKWKRWLAASVKRPSVGGVLLVLDGDAKTIHRKSFCAAAIAAQLADEAKGQGGGRTFSVAVVFARQEYESWLIPGLAAMAGRQLSNGRLIRPGAQLPTENLEEKRDTKGWINSILEGGYRPTRDQAALTEMVDLQAIRNCKLRSFRRLEAALAELVTAIREGVHVATPIPLS